MRDYTVKIALMGVPHKCLKLELKSGQEFFSTVKMELFDFWDFYTLLPDFLT